MDKAKIRFSLAILMVAAFLAWIAAAIFYLMPKVLDSPAAIDPMMALIAGLGFGSITQLFAVLITLSWQFYFRKAGEPKPIQ